MYVKLLNIALKYTDGTASASVSDYKFIMLFVLASVETPDLFIQKEQRLESYPVSSSFSLSLIVRIM